MIVYRLEHTYMVKVVDGLTGKVSVEPRTWGVFGTPIEMKYEDGYYNDHPCMVKGYYGIEDHRFGCDSLDKLVEYFGSDFAYLLKQGAQIRAYKVNKRWTLSSEDGAEMVFSISKAEQVL